LALLGLYYLVRLTAEALKNGIKIVTSRNAFVHRYVYHAGDANRLHAASYAYLWSYSRRRNRLNFVRPGAWSSAKRVSWKTARLPAKNWRTPAVRQWASSCRQSCFRSLAPQWLPTFATKIALLSIEMMSWSYAGCRPGKGSNMRRELLIQNHLITV
jgi:hypothetical protein